MLTDIWYASVFNRQEIKQKLQKDFILAMKSNRLVALSLENKKLGRFVRIDFEDKIFEKKFYPRKLKLELDTTKLVYLKGLDFPVQLTKQVFKNQDDSEGIFYLVSSDINLNYDQITTIYQKLWNVEVFHKSI